MSTKCIYCGYIYISNTDLEMHMSDSHVSEWKPIKCDVCDLTSKTEEKLSLHICKVKVRNPTFKSLYTKDWYNANGCNAVYCTVMNQDVIWLHSGNCWDNRVNNCWKYTEGTKVQHCLLNEVISNGNLNWQ